jgi:tRNA(Arg) A34 adenosine deaminase TadA
VFDDAWRSAPVPLRRCLELAHRSLADGGLAVGAVLAGAGGDVRAEGRNRAYDPPGGPEPLQGTPLAHAETNALAVARTGWDLGALTLWSTQEPCAMCAAAAAFTGVGAIRYLAPDPWALATGNDGSAAGPRTTGPADDVWLVAANLLFLQSVANARGPGHPTLARCRELEPETTALVRPAGDTAWLTERWDGIARAAEARRARTGER